MTLERLINPEEHGIVAFLYILLRDDLPAGRVEQIIEEHIEKLHKNQRAIEFSNPHLADYARELYLRLKGL